ncbi:hypothetical protein DRO26_02245, partial [Candidatus Bathyarchaeota archaeon]
KGVFPRRILILVAGNPGTGKTIFSACFLYHSAVNCGENGVYVSFTESSEFFYRNMKNLGLDFKKLEEEKKFKYLDLSTVREDGLSSLLSRILEEVFWLNAKRLVVDSLSAIVQAFEKPIDVRVTLHTILSKIIHQAKCTTLLIVEIPFGEERTSFGVEEFMADGVIVLKAGELYGRMYRSMEIRKIRGTPLPERTLTFTLSGGFKAFPPFKPEPIKHRERFKPIPDLPERFSTGSPDLDNLIGGGFRKGSLVLLEVDKHVSTLQYHLVLSPTPWNFLASGRAVMIVPSVGVDYTIVRERVMEAGLTETELNKLLKIFIPTSFDPPKKPYIVTFGGKDIEEDYQKYIQIEEELMSKNGQPILRIIGVDLLVTYYGKEAAAKIWSFDATRIREKGNLGIVIFKPGYTSSSKMLSSVADVHLKLTRKRGALIFYGIKPRTNLHIVEMDVSSGVPLPKLTPIM